MLLCSNLGSKKGNRPQLSKEGRKPSVRMNWCGGPQDLPSPPFWWVGLGREGEWQIVKKYACGESSKTVRISDVFLDSGKFIFILCIFQIFYNEYVFYKSEK